ncbi:hypothetical protein FCV66_13555 [Enterovibrio norvegicus]|uniref:anti-phage ZorAB system protein ZorA n=1 Tax=Enterovibrio norvegicus TaxID=188144 RepID=UPI0010BE2916|nr:anti-phage ZorAB system protein ZorA [Enterovibrio norvegicus]TKF13391.1 hypothetical protein FCV66_13555 [Enterovibrio norvegicus]
MNFVSFPLPRLPGEAVFDLSDIFIWLTIAIFAIFTIKLFLSFIFARSNVTAVKKALKGVDTRSFSSQKFDISERIKRKKLVAELWAEFEETLIEVRSTSGDIVYRNTLSSSEFFNTSTLAQSISESRLTAAVPGFLTAIGVLGTFLGLQLGLAGLNLGADASTDELRSGIDVMIGGASVAFSTSVWGVLLSLTFNFFDKWLDRAKRNRISKLQSQIDAIFPRITPEELLSKMAADGEQSRESIQGLAEKIGDKLQETMTSVKQDITDSLETALKNVMAPAMNQLVQQSSESSTLAIEALIGKFMDSFGEQGVQHRQAMDRSAESVNDAMGSLGEQLSNFITKAQQVSETAARRDEELKSQLEQTIGNIASVLDDREEVLAQRDQLRSQALDAHMSDIQTSMHSVIDASEKANSRMALELTTTSDKLLSKVVESSEKAALTAAERDEHLKTQMECVISGLVASVEQREQKQDERDKQRTELLETQILKMQSTIQAAISASEQANSQAKNELTLAAQGLLKDVAEKSEQLNQASEERESKRAQALEVQTLQMQNMMQSLMASAEKSAAQANRDLVGTSERLLSDVVAQSQQLGKAAEERDSQLKAQMEQTIASLLSEIESRNSLQFEENRKRSEALEKQVLQMHSGMQELMSALDKMNTKSAQELAKAVEDMITSVDKTVNAHLVASGKLLNQGEELQSSFKQTSSVYSDAASMISSASSSMHSAAEELTGFGQRLDASSLTLGEVLKDTITSGDKLSERNSEIASELDKLNHQLMNGYQSFENVQTALNSTIETAGSSFDEMRNHQNEYLEALRRNVEDLAKQMTQLLSEFAHEAQTQTSDRLGHWNEQTAHFTTTMTNAMKTLAGVVDEMEGKLQ